MFRVNVLGNLLGVCLLLFPGNVLAQITSDTSLDRESSRLTQIGKDGTVQIDGGAQRGGHLFHSFRDFNVGEGKQVYFANPVGVETIFSRVTGSEISRIFGRLGVQGKANLFLLNPNGIIFGKNAQLDIKGSFVASAGSRFSFPDGSEYSAIDPQAPPLLTITTPIGLQQITNSSGTISNAGQLAVGQDLTLVGRQLDLQGQLQAGRNVTLQAQEMLKIRDSITAPFLATAGEKMVIQGDRGVDIFALSHPRSAFFSGKDMILRSSSAIGGDARFWSGGNFRIEQLDQSLGDLFSPFDPVIRSSGDVSFNNYVGASLHVLAGGSVTAGNITIVGADSVSAITEAITLSNGAQVAIDGNTQPTLDIRTGVDPKQVGSPLGVSGSNGLFLDAASFDLSAPVTIPTATSAAITVDNIVMQAADGKVLLTNQYFKNEALDGAITIGSIRTDGEAGSFSGDSSSVVVDARSDLSLQSGIFTASGLGKVGDITLLANGQISMLDGARLDTRTFGDGKAGDVKIQARSLLLRDAFINTGTSGSGHGGNVAIQAREQVTIQNNASISTEADVTVPGNAGSITIQALQLMIENNTFLSTSSSGSGTAGNIFIDADQVILRNNASLFSTLFDTTELFSQNPLLPSNGAAGDVGGAIIIRAKDSVLLDGQSSVATSALGKNSSGSLVIDTQKLDLQGEAVLATVAVGLGNAGTITLKATDEIQMNNGGVISSTLGSGAGGIISFQTNKLVLRGNSVVSTDTLSTKTLRTFRGDSLVTELLNLVAEFDERLLPRVDQELVQGDSGDLFIQARERTEILGGSILSSGVLDRANGGRLEIVTPQLKIENATVTTTTTGSGKAGLIEVKGAELVEISNGNLTAETGRGSSGLGGDMSIDTQRLLVQNQGTVSASTNGTGRGGTLTINAPNSISLTNNSRLAVEATGQSTAGNLIVNTGRFLLNNSQATVSSQQGSAGNLAIDAKQIFLNNGRLTADTAKPDTSGANIALQNVDVLILRNGSQISARARNDANGGNVTIDTSKGFIVAPYRQDSDIIASANRGRGGNIQISTQGIFGLQEGKAVPGNQTNDIDASSELGTQGTVTIVQPNTDPEQGLIELPADFLDRSNQISQACTPKNATASSFVNSGRGSLAPTPFEPLEGNIHLSQLASIDPPNSRDRSSNSAIPNSPASESIIEAQGWVKDAQGKVTLVANSNTATTHPQTLGSCH